MASLADLKKEIAAIKERNARVEFDKAWETSLERKILLSALTYIVVLSFFLLARLPDPFLNSLVPALAFFLSSSTLSLFKRLWLEKRRKQAHRRL